MTGARSRHRRRRPLALAAAGALFAVVVVTTALASAAGLGGLQSRTLLAQQAGSGAISDTFPYPAGTSLDGRSTPSGGTWTVTGGSLVVTSAGTVQGATNGTVYGTVPFTSCNTRIGVDIRSQGSSTFGLLINAATTGTPSTAVLYSNAGAGTITLARVSAAGVRTVRAQANQVGGGSNKTRFLIAEYESGTYRVRFDNVVVLTWVVPAGERAAIEANCNVGIMVDSDTKSTFDNFQAFAL